MKILSIFLATLFWIGPFSALAEERELTDEEIEQSAWKTVSVVIGKSTKDFDEAKRSATELAKNLKVPLNLRKLTPNEKLGLSFPKELCEKQWGTFPCYLPRGRHDDGAYVSVEYSSAFKEFQPGYYIVVLGSFRSETKKARKLLKNAKKFVPDSYIKNTKVYVGCMS